jgi:hypothetical protein
MSILTYQRLENSKNFQVTIYLIHILMSFYNYSFIANTLLLWTRITVSRWYPPMSGHGPQRNSEFSRSTSGIDCYSSTRPRQHGLGPCPKSKPNKVHAQVIHSSKNTILNGSCKVRNHLIITYNPNSTTDLSVTVLAGAPPLPLESKLSSQPNSASLRGRSILLVQHHRQVRSQHWHRLWGTQ